jgi:hypothetical protein
VTVKLKGHRWPATGVCVPPCIVATTEPDCALTTFAAPAFACAVPAAVCVLGAAGAVAAGCDAVVDELPQPAPPISVRRTTDPAATRITSTP